MKTAKTFQTRCVRVLIGILAIFLIFGPLSSLVIWSFAKTWHWPGMLPQEWSTMYWAKVGDTSILKSLGVSLLIAAVTMLICVVLTVPLAYVMARRSFPCKALIMLAFMLPQAFPQLPVFVNLMTDFYKWDLVGTMPGVLLIHVTLGMLYALWIMVSVFQSIPRSLELAACNLGAGQLRAFFQITLPQAVPGILSAAILVFLNSLDEFTGSLLIGAPYIKTLSVFMYNTAMGYEMQVASVAALLLAAPGILMLLVLDRFLKAEYLSGFGKV